MGIDMQISLSVHVQIDERMLGQQRQHVVEKADTRRDFGLPTAVELERERDLSFAGVSLDFGNAWHSIILLNGWSHPVRLIAAELPTAGRFQRPCRP